MIDWLRSQGARYRVHNPGQPNYIITASGIPNPERPFPINRMFKSKAVLDESSREMIWQKIIQRGESLKAVSAEFGVDIRRVAAVTRLMEVEKEWESKVRGEIRDDDDDDAFSPSFL